MKNLFFYSILFMLCHQINAQDTERVTDIYRTKIGIKTTGGLILSRPEITYAGDANNYLMYKVETRKTLPQISYGLFARKNFGFLYAEANALYSSYGMVYDVFSFQTKDIPYQPMTEKFGYIDLQVLAGLRSYGFRIAVGPVIHILANHTSELQHLENLKEKMRSFSYGFSGAIGYDLERFSFDIKYDKAFRTVGDHIYYGNKKSLFLETPDAVSFSVAYALMH